jgi:hypothetical protein
VGLTLLPRYELSDSGADPAAAVSGMGGSGADPATAAPLQFEDHGELGDSGTDSAVAVPELGDLAGFLTISCVASELRACHDGGA